MAHARDALWESGYDESVEVNQRALIDKVLARYSAEFTGSFMLAVPAAFILDFVEIRFETKAYLDSKKANGTEEAPPPPLDQQALDRKASLVHQWTFKNDGVDFRDEDWNRLKKIAEGNPDEEKIGAFGVGFYSLFSVTEEPFVTSGVIDGLVQLFVRRGKLPDTGNVNDSWTTFEMTLREPASIPKAFDLTRFLASSITFMKQLSDVSVYLDDTRISRLTKQPGITKSVGVPKGLKSTSPKGIMQFGTSTRRVTLFIKPTLFGGYIWQGVKRLHPRSLQLQLQQNPVASLRPCSPQYQERIHLNEHLPLFRLRCGADRPDTVTETSVMLSIFSADVSVKLDQKLRSELHRSTKKNPPANMNLNLIYTGKDEYDASRKDDEKQPEKTGSVFQGLRADIEGSGSARIFIGHATSQTTGIAGHMAARFIPTVERESIDLMDRTVSVWNEELLYVGGFLARAGYELEMDQIRQLWAGAMGQTPSAKPDEELTAWLRARALHAMKFFTFHPSTPLAEVSQKMESAFFLCGGPRQSFSLISTTGVRNATDVRIPDAAFSEFVKELPVIPDEVLSGAKRMIDALQDRGMVKNIEFMDVLQELRARPLAESEMIACFKWWVGVQNQGEPRNLARIRTELLNAAVLCVGEKGTAHERIVPMSSIQTFLNTRTMGAIPTDGPLPAHLLPVTVSRHLDPSQLSTAFPWREFTTIDWMRHITGLSGLDVDHDITKSPQWAERVFQVLARMWPNMAKGNQEEVVTLLRDKTCVPTSAGMKLPQEAYFQSAHIFKDLPIVHMPSGTLVKGALEKIITAIGVRKHVDLQIIFNRMIKTGDWTIAELVKYLVAVQSTLTPFELDRLRATAAFTKAEEAEEANDGKRARYAASALYEPSDVFRQLGLPIIDWGQHPKWRANSEEAKFLYSLGLQRFPSLPVLLGLAASQDQKIRTAALRYFLDNVTTKYSDYDPNNFSQIAYIPAVKDRKPHMAKPSEVYASPEWAALGFAIIDPSVQADALPKLKVREHPPTAALVNLLQKSPPSNDNVARDWFGVLAGRIAEFTPTQLKTLAQMAIVPVTTPGEKQTRMMPPSQCYLRGTTEAQLHSKLFTFVDFGSRANQFLSACGSKQEPSVEEIAKIILDSPRKFYELAGGRDNYLNELRNIAVNHRLFSGATMTRLKRSSVLLGSRRVKKPKPAEKLKTPDDLADLEEDDWEHEYDLLPASQIVVADDPNSYQLFGNSVFTAPQEDLLEAFYLELGSKLLSSLVKQEHRSTTEIPNSSKAADVRTLILERLPLFLHEHTHAAPRVKYSWLNDEKHFVVKMYGKLTVVKTLQFGTNRATQVQESSALARRSQMGPIELLLAYNNQVDMYEVSSSMCRVLFDMPKANDILLFMTILSTDLRSLKRRGYNVDRILRQQQAQRAAQEEAMRKKTESTALVSHQDVSSEKSSLSDLSGQTVTQPGGAFPPQNAPPTTAPAPTKALDMVKRMSDARHSDAWKRLHSAFSNFGSSPSEMAGPSSDARRIGAGDGDSEATSMAGSRTASPMPMGGRSTTPNPPGYVTPKNRIASVIDMAINACKEEKRDHLQSQESQQMVKEALNQGYCDGTGESLNLSVIGTMEDFKVYAARDVANIASVMSTKRDTIARFIYVVLPLLDVYKLPRSSIHFYLDETGQRIAFNRNASLFLSLRYFEAWHDKDVHRGNMTEAFISWYFTLAHEIAHNIVGPHNSEHEFYFSAISEASLPAFVALLSSRT
ncbi:uncharacterized protein B0H18DRAFT_1114703 [Fomitopsis serialis]|uniref:uncharacterized protein n=1 Tax=Fomitopsis serialis TaxID=139415 RepID=UPI002007BFF6|nr:uncharacterized protein B0H18DRAFT_1114703 [Neoantrodia serialis]KAH9934863.1 hypothetical protein B0H18DRAFT_1114703 [Neoantrodia serialis]